VGSKKLAFNEQKITSSCTDVANQMQDGASKSCVLVGTQQNIETLIP
jgi:hypothetical protein